MCNHVTKSSTKSRFVVIGNTVGFFVFCSVISPGVAFAQYGENLNLGSSFSQKEFVPTLISILNTLLGFSALVLFLFVFFAGIRYVTSGGDPKTVKSSTGAIRAGVIGLLIVFGAWVIVSFVFSTLTSV